MKQLFVPVEIAKLAKEKGFLNRCLAHYCGFGDGTMRKDNPNIYKTEKSQLFIYGEYPTSENVSEKLELHCFVHFGVPLYQQLIDWFREKHLIEVNASSYYYPLCYGTVSKIGYSHECNKHPEEEYAENRENGLGRLKFEKVVMFSERKFNSYYEALNKAILKAFELI